MADPPCPAGGILIKVEACAVCGTDLRVYKNGNSRIKGHRILGHEAAGVILEVSRGETRFSPGERVVVTPPGAGCGQCRFCREGWPNFCSNRSSLAFEFDGGFAQKMAVPSLLVEQGHVIRIPGWLDFATACLAEPLSCCINGQEPLRISEKDTVVVVGAGPIGALHVKLARYQQAEKIIWMDINADRLRAAAKLGADLLIDGSQVNPVEAVMQATGGAGADVVIVACSVAQAQEEAMEMVGKRGRVCFFAGLPAGKSAIKIDSNRLHYNQVALYGTFASTQAQSKKAVEVIASGDFNAGELITHRFALDDIAGAFEAVARGIGLKVVVYPH